MNKDGPKAIRLEDYAPPSYLIDSVDLSFDLGEALSVVRSRLTMRRNPEASGSQRDLVLNGERLELVSLSLDGRTLAPQAYTLDTEALTLLGPPQRFDLEVVTHIHPEQNTMLEGLYRSSGNFCTQCEAQGFRKITYFLDRPDVMSRYTTTLVADRERYPVLLSNGNLVEQGESEGGRHFATWRDPYPKPCYLFALVAGRLECVADRYRTRSGRQVGLRIYVQAHNLDQCEHAMASIKKAMAWDEERFGLEYDLDVYMIVAVDDFNMGAMENKGLNLFNSKYIMARPETATDQDYMNIEGVVAHEYFHNWTGNRVTCRDWFQLSLKEGLTVFRDQEFSADMGSPAVQRIHDVRRLRVHQFAEDAGPMGHPVRPQSYIEINNFYTATVYEKGAELVRMIQTLLGHEGFRRGMELYFRRHDGQAVTTDDFVAAMADANDADLSQFKRWYDQAGTPRITASGEWDAASETYTLQVSQHCPPTPGQGHKLPLHVPLRLGLVGPDGQDLPLRLEGEAQARAGEQVLSLRKETEIFRFMQVPARPQPSLLRGFSAPVILDLEYSDEALGLLLRHDSDPFNRWEAGQRLAVKQMKRLIEAHRGHQALLIDEPVMDALGQLLKDTDVDQALLAEMLTLPSESYLSELVKPIDVDAIHAAREALLRALAQRLQGRLLARYQAGRVEGVYAFDARDAGRRRLRNLCLAYLMALDTEQGAALARRQFRESDNMTDTMGALMALNDSARAERDEALQAFHQRWHHDALVMDKWFSLQAVSVRSDTLERVQRLMAHPLFSITNPNRVRALIGAFASANPVRFHARSGAGYRFVADRILELDPLNPQIAARLAKAFARWRHYDGRRQALMKAELERVAARAGLSKDVFEVVSKSLAEP
jgi:aminopeptidase N